MLQQHRFIIWDTQFCGNRGDFLRSHHKMAKKLTLHRVFRHKAELRECKLFLLCNVMQKRARKQQVAVDDVAV